MREVAESPAVPDALVRIIAERFSPETIILFGSCARGDAGPDSDIVYWPASREGKALYERAS
jgi:predicted nucleotidyltransferase